MRVEALLENHGMDDIKQEMRGVVKEGLSKCFSHIQDKLGVQSGDQACYFIQEKDEEATLAWLLSYAMSEIALYAPNEEVA